MDKREFFRSLMGVFVEELHERVQALNQDLLALEHQPPPARRAELLKTLFRSLHSLKGAARSVNAGPIETACHDLEDVLTAVRQGQLAFDPELFALAFDAVDAIQDAGNRLRAEQDLAGGPLTGILDRLRQMLGNGQPKPPPPTDATTANGRRKARDESAVQPPPIDHPTAPSAEEKGATAPPTTPTSAPLDSDVEPASEPAASAPKTDASSFPQPPPAPTIRVASEKLDVLLARAGELLVARQRVKTRAAEIVALREQVAAWATEWRRAEGAVRRLTQPDDSSRSSFHQQVATAPHLSRLAAQALGGVGDHLRKLEHDLERLERDATVDQGLLSQAGAAIEDEVHRLRLLPFGDACRGLDRAARDVARAGGKQVDLVISGEDVEVDRTVLDGLKDPLLHLVRNAVDHGVEAPAARQSVGKHPTARITVSAALRGPRVEVVVADDGRGLDLEAIRAQARKRDLAAPRDDRDLSRLLFMPGFSTAPIITDVSGRGVGLDVVQAEIESLHGAVEVHSEAGRGTRFVLTVPLTLTTIAALLVRAGGQTLALSSANVRTLARFSPDELRHVAGRQVLVDQPRLTATGDSPEGAPIPVADLAGILGLPDTAAASGARRLAVVVVHGDRLLALAVDQILGEQQIVVKSLGARIRRAGMVSGATLLPSGRVALLLNTPRLAQAADRQPRRPLARAAAASDHPPSPRLLVAEDSMTTRMLMKSILEAHGYDVVLAVDGDDAWRKLQELPCDLLISDVDMPGRNGFDLTEAVRASPRLRSLPVVLLTARDSDEDKARGVRARADAYLVKSAFDQRHLLETIGQLL
jgi:two-component system chemotaxis sensor kinase CheA